MEGFPYTLDGEIKYLTLPVSDGCVPVKLIADAIGLSWDSQRKSLATKFGAEIRSMKLGRVFVASATPDTVQGWLNGVESWRLKPDVAARHQHFAMHLAPYLRQMLGGGSVNNGAESVSEMLSDELKPPQAIVAKTLELRSTDVKPSVGDEVVGLLLPYCKDASKGEVMYNLAMNVAKTGVFPVASVAPNMKKLTSNPMFRDVGEDPHIVTWSVHDVGESVRMLGSQRQRVTQQESVQTLKQLIVNCVDDPAQVFPFECNFPFDTHRGVWVPPTLSDLKGANKVNKLLTTQTDR